MNGLENVKVGDLVTVMINGRPYNIHPVVKTSDETITTQVKGEYCKDYWFERDWLRKNGHRVGYEASLHNIYICAEEEGHKESIKRDKLLNIIKKSCTSRHLESFSTEQLRKIAAFLKDL